MILDNMESEAIFEAKYKNGKFVDIYSEGTHDIWFGNVYAYKIKED